MKSRTDSWAYCDTSAMGRRYFSEPGRDLLVRLLVGRRIVSSVLLPLELQAAAGRKVRDGLMPAIHQPWLLERIDGDRRNWTLIDLGEVASRAEDLLENAVVRTLDAIHVASAQVFAARSGADMIFVTADARQARAAASVGLAVRTLEP